MKKLLISAFFCSALISCSDKELDINGENISGAWKAEKFVSDMPNMTEAQQKAGEQEFLSCSYTLNDDNSMEMHSDFFPEGAYGKWGYSSETNELFMSYEYDTIKNLEQYTVQHLTNHQMVLRVEGRNGYVELTLKK